MNMTTLDFELNEWEARFLLEACRTLHMQWFKAAHATLDEDEQADYSNDLGQLEIVQRRLEQEACKVFGPQIRDFSRDVIAVTPTLKRQ
jgi:hypothetical protein